MAPGNAGAILWIDILLPIIGFSLLYAQWKIAQLIESAAQRPKKAKVLDGTCKK